MSIKKTNNIEKIRYIEIEDKIIKYYIDMIIINKLMLQNWLKILSNNNKIKHKNKNNLKYKSPKKNSHNNQILFNINSSKLFKEKIIF